jgi:hypothetical protein
MSFLVDRGLDAPTTTFPTPVYTTYLHISPVMDPVYGSKHGVRPLDSASALSCGVRNFSRTET